MRDPAALVREYLDRLLNRRDLSACEALLAPGYVDHDAPPGTPPGPAATRDYVAAFLDLHPTLRVTVEDTIECGDAVAARVVWRGRTRDGADYHQAGLVMIRVDGAGLLAERWSVYAPPPA
jgi:ketosteroid isomerase-like protein